MILAKAPSIYQLTRPPGIIFDFDGVLVDSLEFHLAAWNQATLQIFQKPIKNPNQLKGMSTRAIAGLISKQFGQQKLAKDLARLKTDKLIEVADKIPLLHGVKSFLEQCHARALPMAIGSNSSKHFVQAVVNLQNLPIQIILGFEDAPKQKPHPDIYLACALAMRIPRDQWAALPVFEDSCHGLEAAKKAQMLPIGVATLHPRELLLEKGAQAVVDHLGQVNLVLD